MIFGVTAFILVGIVAGLLSGLLGIGGGVVTIPCLILIFKALNLPASSMMHLAIGTSLAAMVFNTLSASYSHYKKESVLFHIVKPMSLGVIGGALVGAIMARFLSSDFLQVFFGIFEALLGIHFLLPERKVLKERTLPSFWGLSVISLFTSTLSTILGIGGGIINVPILTHFHVPVRKAIGTSAALSFLISLFGAISFLIMGMKKGSTHDTVGYLYMPAFIIIGVVHFLPHLMEQN